MGKTYVIKWPDGTHSLCIAPSLDIALDLADIESDPGITSIFECKVDHVGEFYMPLEDDNFLDRPGETISVPLPSQDIGKVIPRRLFGDMKEAWEKHAREEKELEDELKEIRRKRDDKAVKSSDLGQDADR